MKAKVHRRTVDLSAYPDLVVIYLGMRVNAILGLKTLLGFGPEIAKSVEAQPDGLLLHESMVFSLLPVHVGMRQYWRDFESLERSDPHRLWWRQFLCNSGGTGFWHEAYFMRGGMEAVYDDMVEDIGFLRFAPVLLARGTRFSARTRAQYPGEPAKPAPIGEEDSILEPRNSVEGWYASGLSAQQAMPTALCRLLLGIVNFQAGRWTTDPWALVRS